MNIITQAREVLHEFTLAADPQGHLCKHEFKRSPLKQFASASPDITLLLLMTSLLQQVQNISAYLQLQLCGPILCGRGYMLSLTVSASACTDALPPACTDIRSQVVWVTALRGQVEGMGGVVQYGFAACLQFHSTSSLYFTIHI